MAMLYLFLLGNAMFYQMTPERLTKEDIMTLAFLKFDFNDVSGNSI
jgi:hypothetical protein